MFPMVYAAPWAGSVRVLFPPGERWMIGQPQVRESHHRQ
uniref:Uncharacterized protein n=1 Tax=uncultured bacterium F42-01 TaxID=1191438 RepID=I3VII4_9BACT|nr:hypothetical protein [uncultured bacterium F42-01]